VGVGSSPLAFRWKGSLALLAARKLIQLEARWWACGAASSPGSLERMFKMDQVHVIRHKVSRGPLAAA